MAVYTYEDVIPSPIANTTVKKRFADGIHRQFVIEPIDGYVLHDQKRDWYNEYDMEGNPIGEPTLGFTRGDASCEATYDFVANPREFYAVPANTVPADQIFGVGNGHVTA